MAGLAGLPVLRGYEPGGYDQTLSRFACSDWFMSLSGYGCCAFGGAMNQHTLPVGLNGGRIIPEVSVRVEKEQAIPGRLEVGGIQVQFDVQIALGREAQFLVLSRFQVILGKEHAAGNGLILQIGEGEFQAGKGLRVGCLVMNQGVQRNHIAVIGIGFQFGRLDGDQVGILRQGNGAFEQRAVIFKHGFEAGQAGANFDAEEVSGLRKQQQCQQQCQEHGQPWVFCGGISMTSSVSSSTNWTCCANVVGSSSSSGMLAMGVRSISPASIRGFDGQAELAAGFVVVQVTVRIEHFVATPATHQTVVRIELRVGHFEARAAFGTLRDLVI